MNHHAFSPRAAVAAAGIAFLLAAGAATAASAAVTATAASAAVTSTPAPSAPPATATAAAPLDSPATPQVTITTPRGSATATAPQTTPAVPAAPTGLTAQARHGEVILSWSPPPGGLKADEGYLIYMGTSPGQEGAKPSVPYLIEGTTSYTVAPLDDGTRYYFQVTLLEVDQMSARSAEVSAVPGTVPGAGQAPGAGGGTTPGTGPTPGTGTGGKPGVGKAGSLTTPLTASPLPGTELAGHRASPSPPVSLIVLLAAVSLAATGGATVIMLVQRRRRRHGRGYAPVPAPRRPHDGQPAEPYRRIDELNGPRYR